MKKVLTLILLLQTSLCFSQNADNWSAFTTSTYSIQYPSSWSLDSSKAKGTDIAILSPPEDSKDQLRDNVNVLIQNLAGMGLDLDKYVELSEQQIKQMGDKATLIESTRKKNAENTEYQRVILVMPSKEFNLKYLQYYYVIDEKAYVLTFTAEVNKFDAFKDTGERILNSWFLIK